MMKELVEFIARSLVDNPDDVQVTEIEQEGSIIIELRVALMIWKGHRQTREDRQVIRTLPKLLQLRKGNEWCRDYALMKRGVA